jgi:hypothetical protein
LLKEADRMAFMRSIHLPLAAVLAATALACGPEKPDGDGPPPLRSITSSDALTVANRNLKNGLVSAARNGAFLEDSKILGSIGADDRAPCTDEQGCGESGEQDLEAQAAKTADAIAAQILTAGNIELAEDTKVVLRIKPEVACVDTSSSVDFAPGGDCSASYSAVAIRLELSSRREGDIDVRLTIDDVAVGGLSLYANSIGVELDLGGVVAAANKLMIASGEADQTIQGTFQGRIGASLSILGPEQIEVAVSILSPIVFDMTFEGSRYRMEAGSASPLLSAKVDGAQDKLTITSNSGGAKLIFPLPAGQDCTNGPNGEQVCEPRPAAGDIEIDIPSSNSTIEITANDVITGHVRMSAPLSARHEGVEIASFDFNPSQGRQLDWTVLLEDEAINVELGQTLSAIARINLASLADELDVPPGARNETFTLDLNGAARPSLKLDLSSDTVVGAPGEPPPPPAPKAIIEMTAGSLRMAALNAGDSVTVSAGQCLYSVETSGEEASLFSGLESRSCD